MRSVWRSPSDSTRSPGVSDHAIAYASVSSGDLAEAEREATLIYAAAGITTIWMNPGEPADSVAPGRHSLVLLLDRAMSQNLIDAQQNADDVLARRCA
jgi:hypothetical protein